MRKLILCFPCPKPETTASPRSLVPSTGSGVGEPALGAGSACSSWAETASCFQALSGRAWKRLCARMQEWPRLCVCFCFSSVYVPSITYRPAVTCHLFITYHLLTVIHASIYHLSIIYRLSLVFLPLSSIWRLLSVTSLLSSITYLSSIVYHRCLHLPSLCLL